MENLKPLYEAAKQKHTQTAINEYTTALHGILERNNPMEYVTNLEYIIKNSIGLESFEGFINNHGLPIMMFESTIDILEESIRKCEIFKTNQKPFVEAVEMLYEYMDNHKKTFLMYETCKWDKIHESYIECYYTKFPMFKQHSIADLNIEKMQETYGNAMIADIILYHERFGKLDECFNKLSLFEGTDSYHTWLYEMATDYMVEDHYIPVHTPVYNPPPPTTEITQTSKKFKLYFSTEYLQSLGSNEKAIGKGIKQFQKELKNSIKDTWGHIVIDYNKDVSFTKKMSRNPSCHVAIDSAMGGIFGMTHIVKRAYSRLMSTPKDQPFPGIWVVVSFSTYDTNTTYPGTINIKTTADHTDYFEFCSNVLNETIKPYVSKNILYTSLNTTPVQPAPQALDGSIDDHAKVANMENIQSQDTDDNILEPETVTQLESKSLYHEVSSILNEKHSIFKESMMLGQEADIIYTEHEINTIRDLISFKEYMMLNESSFEEMNKLQSEVYDLYTELSGLVADDNSLVEGFNFPKINFPWHKNNNNNNNNSPVTSHTSPKVYYNRTIDPESNIESIMSNIIKSVSNELYNAAVRFIETTNEPKSESNEVYINRLREIFIDGSSVIEHPTGDSIYDEVFDYFLSDHMIRDCQTDGLYIELVTSDILNNACKELALKYKQDGIEFIGLSEDTDTYIVMTLGAAGLRRFGYSIMGRSMTEAAQRTKKTGEMPAWLSRNHDSGYGEDKATGDDRPAGDDNDYDDDLRRDVVDDTPVDSGPSIEPYDYDHGNGTPGESDDDDDESNTTPVKNDGGTSGNNTNYYYYTYTNSNNQNSNSHNSHHNDRSNHSTNTDNSHNKRTGSHNYNQYKDSLDGNEPKEELKESSQFDVFNNIFESADSEVGSADDDKPKSDHPIKDILTDVDRKLTSVNQKAKKKVQDGQNAARAFVKPAKRTTAWISKMVNEWKDLDETKLREKIADPKERSMLTRALSFSIKTGSLLKAGLLLNPIFMGLAALRKADTERRYFKLRNDMIGELKADLEVIDEKIKDADIKGDNAAKYKLMRFRTEYKKKLAKVGAANTQRKARKLNKSI